MKKIYDADIVRGVTDNYFNFRNQQLQKDYMHVNLEKKISEKILLTIEHLPSPREIEGVHLQDRIDSINAAEDERKRREKMNEERFLGTIQ